MAGGGTVGSGGAGGRGGSGTAGSGGASGRGGVGMSGSGGSAGSYAGGTGGTGGSVGSAGSDAGGQVGSAGSGPAGSDAGGTSAGCASACGPTQSCVGTKCLTNDGQLCTLAEQCATNSCKPFYVDADGDGFGAGAAMGFCGTSTPVGYATKAGDCCDDSSFPIATMIHPGAGFQTTSANGACGVTWDYDCSSVVETSLPRNTCSPNSVFPDNCIDVPVYYPSKDCGTSQPLTITCRAHETSCVPYPHSQRATLGCK